MLRRLTAWYFSDRLLDSLATIVNLIANTTTDTGLHIETSVDYAIYEKGIEVTDEELELLNIKREKFHREWNYMIKPQVWKSLVGEFHS